MKGRKKQPHEFMNELVPSGPRVDHDEDDGPAFIYKEEDIFEARGQWLDPVDFCLALINADEAVLKKVGITKPPSISQRLYAASIAIPYTNKRQPQEVNAKVSHSWADAIQKAEDRLDQRIDINDLDRASTTH